jgi:hypothetical protein
MAFSKRKSSDELNCEPCMKKNKTENNGKDIFNDLPEELRWHIWTYLDTKGIAYLSQTSRQYKKLSEAYVKITENPFFQGCTREPIIGPAGFTHKCIAKCDKITKGEFWLCSLDAVRYLPYDYKTMPDGSTVLLSDDQIGYPTFCEYHYQEAQKQAEDRSESARLVLEEIVNANPVNLVKASTALNVMSNIALPSETYTNDYAEQIIRRYRAI